MRRAAMVATTEKKEVVLKPVELGNRSLCVTNQAAGTCINLKVATHTYTRKLFSI